MQSKAINFNNNNKFGFTVREKSINSLTRSSFLDNYLESSNEILRDILISEYRSLMPHFQRVVLLPGQELFAEGEKNEYVYFPETCVISHLYNLADGNTIEIAMVGREGVSGFCSLFGTHLNTHRAQITFGGEARRIPVKILSQAFSNGGRLQKLLLDYFSLHLNQISQRVGCGSFHEVENRLCSWLLMLGDRTRNKRLRITHEQISLILGVHRPTLSVAAKSLREMGLINYVRGYFEIINRRGLENLACECYSTAHIYR